MRQKLKYLPILAIFMLCMYKPVFSEAVCEPTRSFADQNQTYSSLELHDVKTGGEVV